VPIESGRCGKGSDHGDSVFRFEIDEPLPKSERNINLQGLPGGRAAQIMRAAPSRANFTRICDSS